MNFQARTHDLEKRKEKREGNPFALTYNDSVADSIFSLNQNNPL